MKIVKTQFKISSTNISTLLNPFQIKTNQNYSTQYSPVVPHQSTDWAINCLTAEIRRDPVLSIVYGRSCCVVFFSGYMRNFYDEN